MLIRIVFLMTKLIIQDLILAERQIFQVKNTVACLIVFSNGSTEPKLNNRRAHPKKEQPLGRAFCVCTPACAALAK